MIKLLILMVCGYFMYQWWVNPKQLPGKGSDEDDFTDYEEIE